MADIDRIAVYIERDINYTPWGRYRHWAISQISHLARPDARFIPLLSVTESEYYCSIVVAKRKTEFLSGRILSKYCVHRLLQESGYSETDPRTINIIRRGDGSPEVFIEGGDGEPVNVAISHGGKYLLCAAARRRRLGLDVERIDRRLMALKESFTEPQEEMILRSQVSDEIGLVSLLTRLWSAKESIVKYFGTGLFHGLYNSRLIRLEDNDFILSYTAGRRETLLRSQSFMHDGHVFTFVEAADGESGCN